MSAPAIQKALERQRRGETPCSRPSHLRLVYDVEGLVVHHETHDSIWKRIATATNRAFAFMLVIVACVGIAMAAYAAGEFDRDVRDARAVVAEIEVAPLPPPMEQIGTYDREKGRRG